MDEDYISIKEFDKRIAIFNKKIKDFEKEVYDIKHIFLNTKFNSTLYGKITHLERDIIPREQRIGKLEKQNKYKDQKWFMHRIMNFTYHLPIMHYIHENIKRIVDLEKEFEIWKTEEYTEQENSKRIDTISAVINKILDRIIYNVVDAEEIVFAQSLKKQLDGSNWNPTLGDGIPEDARFDATDGGEPSIHKDDLRCDYIRKNDYCSLKDIECYNHEGPCYEFKEPKEEQEAFTMKDGSIDFKKKEAPRKGEAEPFDIMQLGRRMSLIKYNKLMNELVAEFIKRLKSMKACIQWIKESNIKAYEHICAEINKDIDYWEARKNEKA